MPKTLYKVEREDVAIDAGSMRTRPNIHLPVDAEVLEEIKKDQHVDVTVKAVVKGFSDNEWGSEVQLELVESDIYPTEKATKEEEFYSEVSKES